MIKVGFSILFLLAICGFVFSQSEETKHFREIRDKSFRDSKMSPLLADDFAQFKELNYFPFDESYQIKVDFIKTGENKTFLMPTSTGGSRKYLKIGTLNFQLNGKDYSVSAFSREIENIKDLFVPFKDLTNGEQTYSAGRYVYLKMPKKGEAAILDFNLGYNPSCAYGNESFACTLPPKENFLQVEVKAGEKKFISLKNAETLNK